MTNKTKVLHVRLTDDEAVAFKKFAESLGEKRANLLRKMVRESINQTPDLLSGEQSVMMFAIRQLAGIARNLNQVTAAIHIGKALRSVDESYLTEIKKYVTAVKESFEGHVKNTKDRCVGRT